jgi:Domain of unknown function (DUF4062)
MAGPSVRLFISCVSDEFGADRDALRQALTRPNVEVKIQKDFKALGGDTLAKLETYIEECQAVVHLVGDMTGSAPNDYVVHELLARRPDLKTRLPPLGAALDAGEAISYTQWESWLALYFRKDLVIAAPTPVVGANEAKLPLPTDSATKQAEHLKRLRGVGRYVEIKFADRNHLVAQIYGSAVIKALAKAQAAPATPKTRELWGATIAATVAVVCLLAIAVGYLLPRELPIFTRVLAATAIGLFLLLGAYHWDILGGPDEPDGSRERADYEALRHQLESGGTPAKVYRKWLSQALDRVDVFFGDQGRDDKSWFARALGLETHGARWTASAFDRCLLLALLYPIVTIVAVWAWSGHMGVVE